MNLYKPQSIPEIDCRGSLTTQRMDTRPLVWQTPRTQALLAETWERECQAKRREWTDRGLYQPYEAFASGEPCRACGRPLLDDSPLDDQDAPWAASNVDNADFRSRHENCVGFWNVEACSVEHCHQCCPPPPLSPTQVDVLGELLQMPATYQFTWILELTCGHTESAITGDGDFGPATARCAACSATRGVVTAAHSVSEAAGNSDATILDTDALADSRYRPLTNEQWSLIKRIVQPDDVPRRGRPRADARMVVNAILYREHTGIAWRELPPTFGAWQTTARRHRQLTTNGRWEKVRRALAKSDPAETIANDSTT